MFDPPMTKEEAAAHRYNRWGGNPKGFTYNPHQCAYETYNDQTRMKSQCLRKPGHGPDGLYCKQHARKVTGRQRSET